MNCFHVNRRHRALSCGDPEIRIGFLSGAGIAANQTLDQSTRMGVCIRVPDLDKEKGHGATLRAQFLRDAHVFMVQASQTALTNRHASLEERRARWMVAVHLREGRHFLRPMGEKLHVVDWPGLIERAAGSDRVCEAGYERPIDGHFDRPVLAA